MFNLERPSGERFGNLGILRFALCPIALRSIGMACLAVLTLAPICRADPTSQPSLQARLGDHVTHLSVTIGQRNLEHPQSLDRAADYLRDQLKSFGYEPQEVSYRCRGFDVHNIFVDVIGTEKPGEILVIGAHYDSVNGSPGANDNASGTAAVVELARRFKTSRPARTIRFVLFPCEVPPHFQTPEMGSLVFADECKRRGENIVGMISIETIGCFSDEENSQRFPVPQLALLYPTKGNFLACVSDQPSRPFGQRVFDLFRAASTMPVEFAALPAEVPGVGWSDHWSFWQNQYPAVMFTDTAPFRYAHYHKDSDLPGMIDFARMTRVVEGIAKVVESLAGEAR